MQLHLSAVQKIMQFKLRNWINLLKILLKECKRMGKRGKNI